MPDVVRDTVRRYWERRAQRFDDGRSKGLHSEDQRAAWETAAAGWAAQCGTGPLDVLDVGCGTGFLALLFAGLGHRATGVDLAADMVRLGHAKRTGRDEISVTGRPAGHEVGASAPTGEPAAFVQGDAAGALPGERATFVQGDAGALAGGRAMFVQGDAADASAGERVAFVQGDTAGAPAAFVQGDAEGLPFRDAAFDLVVERFTLWTLPSPRAALLEWARVLRTGGRVVLVEGEWREVAHHADYQPIRDDLPLYGGLPAADMAAVVEDSGAFAEIDVRPMADPTLWGGATSRERYAVHARRAGHP